MGLMIQFHIRKKRWVPMIALPFIVCTCIFHCFMIWMEWNDTTIAPELITLRNTVTSLALPAVYIVVCSKSGTDWLTLDTLCLTSLALVNFSGGMTFFLDTQPAALAPNDDQVHFMYCGQNVMTIRIIGLIIVIQILWIATWAFQFRKRMQKENLHMAKHSKQLIKMFVIGFSIIFVSILVPNSIWNEHPNYLYAFFVPLSATITAIELTISWGWMLTPISDQNDEPAVNTVSIDNEKLKAQIKELIEGNRLYLKSDIKVSDIAMALRTNRNCISKAVNDMTGGNFSSYLNSLRISHARKLIIDNPSMTLETVADKCGFTSASSFTKVFKRVTGTTPSKIKKLRK